MLFSLLLTALLAQAPAQPPVPTAAEAAQLAADGRTAAALAAFQARASADPNDRPSRIWIGRLHERMGNPELAEPVYRSVLLEDPGSFDAMYGLGSSLLAQHATDEALEVLEEAERLAPQNPDLLALLGRTNLEAGRLAIGVGYLERASALAPSLPSQLALDDARRAYFHRIETSGFAEQFDSTMPDSQSGEVTLNYRLRESLRILARGQVLRKFDTTDSRGGAGVAWRWTPLVWLSGQALVGPDNTVLPEGDYLGSLAFAAGPALLTGTVRYFDFTGAWMSVVAPTIAWPASDRLTLGLGYAFSTTESNTFSGREHGSSWYARGAWRLRPRLWATFGHASGVEDFDTMTIDRIGDFDADTASVGVRIDLPTLTSIVGGYERQWREGGVVMGRIRLSLAHSF